MSVVSAAVHAHVAEEQRQFQLNVAKPETIACASLKQTNCFQSDVDILIGCMMMKDTKPWHRIFRAKKVLTVGSKPWGSIER